MAIQIRIRRDTAANWTSTNPVLGLGEPGLETDTRKLKYGDGVTAWTSLPYGSDSGFDGAYSSLTGAPSLATVATSGSYNDLSNKPSIPSITGLATETYVNNKTTWANIADRPTFSNVATSGSYNDLTNQPTIPTNLDSLTDVTITTPSNGQVLKYNGSAWVNGADTDTGITLSNLSVSSTTASGGGSLSYDNTTGAFTFAPASVPSLTGYATETYVNDKSTWANISGRPTFSNVATSGSYNDLSNTPSIPSITGLLSWSTVPALATSTGTAGQIAYDASYLYVCVATDTWVRTPLSTW